jgi:hypothetical protein
LRNSSANAERPIPVGARLGLSTASGRLRYRIETSPGAGRRANPCISPAHAALPVAGIDLAKGGRTHSMNAKNLTASGLLLLALAALAAGAPAQLPSPLFASADGDAPAGYAAAVALDLEQDGDLDAIDLFGQTLVNDGGGRFVLGTLGAQPGAFGQYDAIGVGDFDGDGAQDVAAFAPGGVGVGSVPTFLRSQGGGLAAHAAPAPPTLPAGAVVARLDVADFDQNGLDDLLVTFVGTSSASQPPRLYYAFAGFSFAAASPSVAGAFSTQRRILAVDDFDANGFPDLLATIVPANAPSAPLGLAQVLLGTGSGFVAQTPVTLAPANATVDAVVVGDFDGDGNRDVLVDQRVPAPPPSGPILQVAQETLFLGDGAGGLAAGAVFPIAGSTAAVGGFAIDADGDAADEYLRRAGAFWTVYDVAAAAGPSPLQSGFAFPYASTPTSAPLPVPAFVAQFLGTVADFDADGDRDWLVMGRDGVLDLRRADGSGLLRGVRRTLPAEFRGVATAFVFDADADGDADVVGPTAVGFAAQSNDLRTAKNDGFGGFAAPPGGVPTALSLGTADPVALGDFDGDGDRDAVWAFGLTTITTHRNTGAGAFIADTPFVASCDQLAAADLNGDGADDLVLASRAGPGPVVMFGGGPTLGPPVGPIGPTASGALALADFDADGDVDLFDGVIYANNGAGGFSPSPSAPSPAPNVALSAAAGDLDGDGDVDLVADGVAYLRTPAGFGPGLPIALAPAVFGTNRAVLLDLDDDGFLDLLGGCTWYRGLGTGAFAAGETIAAARVFGGVETSSAFPRGLLHAGDLDGDGDVDLVDENKRVYVNRRRHLVPGSPARLGRVGTLELAGTPGALCDVVVATARAAAPIPAGPWGLVFVDPAAAALLTTLALDASGTATIALSVPNAPSLVGLSLAWQLAYPLEGRLSALAETPVVGF